MENNISENIIKEGFFNKELPSEFNSRSLADELLQIDVSKSKLSNKGVNKWAKLVQYSIPKKNKFRRIAAIPHPLHYIKLSKVIEDSWSELETHYEKSKVSLTKLELTSGKLKNKYNFSEKQNIRLENLSFNKYILSIDVNRYYPSIYSHSIPWALHTKAIAKEHSKDMSYLGNKIDLEIRNMQDGQTMGIPIGPLTSAIIQEIIGTAIDDEFQILMGKEIPGFRYTDDMEYYFNTLEEANKALSVITKILKDYNLDTNAEKTRILQLPLEIDAAWVYFFKNFKFKNSQHREKQIFLQKGDLKEYFNQIFKYHIEVDDKGISKYALKVLRNRIIYKENWSMFQSLLLQTALVDTTVIPIVFEIIEAYKYKGYQMDFAKLSLFVHSILNENLDLNNDYEIIWALSFSNKLKISIDKDTTAKLCKYDNALVNILVMVLNDANLIHESADFYTYKSFIASNNLYDENWIFLYECCINNWLDKDSTILNNDNFFKQLSLYNISFVSADYSEVKIDVKNHLSEVCIKKYSSKSNLELDVVFEEVISEYQLDLEEDLKISIFESIRSQIKESEGESEEESEGESEEGSEGESEFERWSKLFISFNMRNKSINDFVEYEYE